MEENIKKELQKLIEYQKKDIELRKLNALIERDAALAEKNKQEKLFNEAKSKLDECERTAGMLVSAYSELQKYVADAEALFNELESAEAENEEQLEDRIKRLESVRGKISGADKKATDLDKRSKDISRVRADAMKSGKIARQKYTEAKDKHNVLVKSKSADVARLSSELDALRGSLSPKLLDEYKKLDGENRFPAVVQATTSDERKGMYNCGGCGLNLSQQSNTLLRDRGWCRCDTCRRIIVKLK